ncbi:pyrophosphate--fructose 6-phosphate 1-phosphotransferase subunit beta 1-like [Triticum aestivum]|uniref:pyrophosphate--fructose 6-phosphate 1-phosphotransferase subunit beta 1-like n=1 Tax=Triticum aestivum TaxID=4565 RepID=UPI001D0268D4|nr:pyrophosphate--fructose 6-phosphate 1-phosphotransferase subunit beta 1-like [Triticum aestivum]
MTSCPRAVPPAAGRGPQVTEPPPRSRRRSRPSPRATGAAAPFAAGRRPSRRSVQRGADEPHRHTLPLPSVLRFHFTLADGPTTTAAAGSPDEIAKLFPNLYGQPSAEPVTSKLLKISVVLSGGQALGGRM